MITGLLLLLISISTNSLFAQARLVIGNTTPVYMNMSGGVGTTGSRLYLVLDNGAVGATAAISCGASGGTGAACPASGSASWIITGGQYNYVKWNKIAGGTTAVFPLGATGTTGYIPVTVALGATGPTAVLVSTWGVAGVTGGNNNAPWAGISDEGTKGAVTNVFSSTAPTPTNAGDEVVIDRWWDIQTTDVTSATLTLNYLGQENTMLAAYNTTTLGIQHWTGTGWNDGAGGITGSVTTTGTAGSVAPGPHAVTGSAVFTQFTPFVVVPMSSPLPVEWLSVGSECISGDEVIHWSTASEQNADHFTLERSLDGTSFAPLANVPATPGGNSNSVKNYFAVDHDPYSGTSYYRVRETDFNGSSMVSDLVTSTGCASDLSFTVYPNPAPSSTSLNVTVSGAKDSEVLIVVTDMLGRDFYSKITLLSSDEQVIAIDPTHQLAAGVYTVVASSNDEICKKKIVVQ